MTLRSLSFSLLLLLPALAAAQNNCCCCKKRDIGQTAYDGGSYETAIAKWQEGKKCSDASSCADLDGLIANARQKIKQRDAAATEQRRQREADAQRQRQAEQKRLADKADDDAWELVKDSQDPKTVQKYLDKYPSGRHAADARKRIKELSPAKTKPDAASTASSGIEPPMVFLRGGAFSMGSTDSDAYGDEKPVHTVNVGDFYLGKYEVTNREYCAFLNEKGNQAEGGAAWLNLDGSWEGEKCRISQTGNTFSVENGYENYPVIYVSWYGARAYANWLVAKTGKKYRLPTEAEWEYAAGNGSRHTKYSWGNNLPSGKQGGNVADETAKKKFPDWSSIFTGYTDGYIYTAPVGQFNANDFGLHDMSGNVWEWCEDVWHSDYNGAPDDGSAWLSGGDQSRRVLRGGSWFIITWLVRASCRVNDAPTNRHYLCGFRLAQDK